MCGIFGQINTNKQGKFNFPAFTTLGVANDSRGGDSCGIFIDGKTEYGIDKTKLFVNFMNDSKLLKSTRKCHIALGHCRKASIGKIDLQRAQPVVIRNDKDEVEYVVIHNGTIHNYKDLAKKYIPDVNIDGMSDSQVMAHIFYHTGFNVLNEYYGGAVFVIVDYRCNEPQIYAFKGKSKIYWTSSNETEERPFYFTITKQAIYFSSIYNWLQPFTTTPIYTLEGNTVINIRNNDTHLYQKINRTNCTQYDYSAYTRQTAYNSYAYDNEYELNNRSCNTYAYGSCQQQSVTNKGKKIKVNTYGLYMFDDNTYIHGTYHVQQDGTIGYTNDSLYLSFWHGMLLKNKACFEFLHQFCIKSKLQGTILGYVIPQTLELLSYHPNCEYQNGDFYIYERLDYNVEHPYQGELQYICEDAIYNIEDGVIVDCTVTKSTESLRKLYTENLQFKIDANALNEVIINECNKQEK